MLLVDRDRVRVRATARRLARSCGRVLTATNADTARAALRERPTLAVVEVLLPSAADGWAVIEAAARDPATPIVIATSDRATGAEAFEAARRGAAAFLPSPFSGRDLALAIGRAAGGLDDLRALAARIVGRVAYADACEVLRRSLVLAAMNRTGGRKKSAAELLAIRRSHLQVLAKTRGL